MPTIWSGTIPQGEAVFGPYAPPPFANDRCRVEFARGQVQGKRRRAGTEWPTDATLRVILEHGPSETGPWAFVKEMRSSGANQEGKAEEALVWFMHDFPYPAHLRSGFLRIRTDASHALETQATIEWR